MKIDALLYIESGSTDDSLTFENRFLPDELSARIRGSAKISSIYFTVDSSFNATINDSAGIFRHDSRDDIGFWKDIFDKTGSDHIVKIYCDSPFLDMSVIEEMIDVHVEYCAEYTYSENLPSGMSCEIISKSLMTSIPAGDGNTLPLGQIIRSNINQFDVELFYKEPDMRHTRIGFRSSQPRDRAIMRNILDREGRIPRYSELMPIITATPEILHTGPSYVEIELTGECDLDCLFCFRKTLPSDHGEMAPEMFEKLLNEMKNFNLPYSVCFGGSGEPMMHSSFYSILDRALKDPMIETVVLETNGLSADGGFRAFLAGTVSDKLRVIFNINGIDENSYKTIHAGNHYERVVDNIIELNRMLAPGSIYVQIMKINETEQFLDRYYDIWEQNTITVILQKQNIFLGRIADRRYSDLSPLDRTPCWHLQRSMLVLSDGTVGFCKQDVSGDYARGSLKDSGLIDIWNKTRKSFIDDYRGTLSKKPDCSICDEWYTFNL